MNSPIEPAKGVWWKPAHGAEKMWVGIAFGWCMVLFAMMPLWHFKGGQNPSGVRSTVEPEAFLDRTEEFIENYRVGESEGIPVVAPPPGSDIYLLARMWQWTPVLKLRAGAEYTLHLSSYDVNHGFSLTPGNINFQVVPGYDYALRVQPDESGEFRIICNEFCGIGHHLMLGRVIVTDEEGNVASGSGTDGGPGDELGIDPDDIPTVGAYGDRVGTDGKPTGGDR